MSNNEAIKEVKKVFWSSAVSWKKNDQKLYMEIFCYNGFMVDLFPKFYFVTQRGIEIKDLINEFKDVDSRELLAFINDLLKKRILVESILSPGEIFYSQNYLFENKYSKEIKINEEKLNEYKEIQLTRSKRINCGEKISLISEEVPDFLLKRKTIRSFDTSKKITCEEFSSMLSVFKQRKEDDGIRKYYYASAGGLYPVDIYLYIKGNRIEDIEKGVYYYDPIDNSINIVNSECEIGGEYQYSTNEVIGRESAFTIFFIYNAEASMPKYGGKGYFYALIDTGIMVQAFTTIAELHDIGLCSIGESNFKMIEKYFDLNKNQIYVHSVEVGLRNN